MPDIRRTWAALAVDFARDPRGKDSVVLRSTTREGLFRLAERRKMTVIESYRTQDDGNPVDPTPTTSDVRDWDAWRNRHGYTPGH